MQKDYTIILGNLYIIQSARPSKFHNFETFNASQYEMNGCDLMSVKDILGHNSLKMWRRYSHLASA